MSVTVRHLNADSTFLLIFSPKTKPSATDLQSANGAFSVLVDPWLVGSSIVNASWFAITNRVVPSAIQHLSEIETPDVLLVSQNKPDHCHKQTLLQLRPEGKTLIAAEPGAAKAIKSWNHFDPHRVHPLAKYDARKRFGNTLRLRIPPLGPDGLPGELNIAFIPAKNYVTGLHNAFGITYQAPTQVKVLASVTTIDLPKKNFSMPFTPASVPAQSPVPMLSPTVARPATSHVGQEPFPSPPRPTTAPGNSRPLRGRRPQLSRSSNTQSSEFLPLDEQPNVLLSSPKTSVVSQSRPLRNSATLPAIDFDAEALIDTTEFANTLPTPPLSPTASSATTSHRTSDLSDTLPFPPSSTNDPVSYTLPHSPSLLDLQARYSRPPTVRPARPKAISILYSPHGIHLADLQLYIQTHLVPLPGALPLTCLFHGFDYAANPWWFGGNIMMGAKGGTEIARALMARTWISAHDEEKDDRGLAVKMLKCERTSPEMVQKKIGEVEDNWECDVRALNVGEEICLSSGDEPTRKQSHGRNYGLGLNVEMDPFKFQGCSE